MRFWQDLERLKTADTPRTARPFVTAAFAMSSDGCLTETRGGSTAISGPEALRVTHQLRACHDAVLVGVGTVISDDPLLTTRLVPGPSPLRVVLDSRLRTPNTARLLRAPTCKPWLVTTARACPQRARALRAAGAELIEVASEQHGVSLTAALGQLCSRGVRSLMLEGGAAVLESFFRAQYVDYVVLTVSPRSLANPLSVTIGPITATALNQFRGRYTTRLGDDRLQAGPLTAARFAQWLACR
jgi:3,4-dihydroxy 2-butanone 4-phosphate synthase/GTP cyclohydrolase II